jgi:hypothetical protein
MNKRGRPFKSANRIARAVRLNEILKDLTDGKSSIADLSKKYGVSHRQISADVDEIMTNLMTSTAKSAETFRALQLARHEDYLKKMNTELDAAIAAQAPASVITLYANTGLKILDQENKLASLYTTKFEVKQETEVTYTLPANQAAEMLAILEAQGLLPSPSVEGEYREIPSEIEGVRPEQDEVSSSNGEAV